jgi:hypothetical protein
VNGSRPFVGGPGVDGGGLTKVTSSTVGETEGLAVLPGELVIVAVPVGLAVVVCELVDVAITEGLAGHALPPALIPAKPWKAVVDELAGEGLAAQA